MFHALRRALEPRRDRAMIVGSDSPALPLDYLEELLACRDDVALGPTEDGGFYAIACRRVHPEMFDRVEWSTRRTLDQTLRALQRCGLTAFTGRAWFDVDTPEDLARLRNTPKLGRHTATMMLMTESNHKLKEGDAAPDIRLDDDQGRPFHLADLKGRNVVLYFYPKADTPGCTKEACEFRDNSRKFTKADTVIVGVSPDKSGAQSKFKDKFDLPFTLLADTGHEAAGNYGVWKEKSMYGRTYMGIERTTFLIGKDGRIKKIFHNVKPAGHAEQVYEALGQLAP